jgi:hypothetical protein
MSLRKPKPSKPSVQTFINAKFNNRNRLCTPQNLGTSNALPRSSECYVHHGLEKTLGTWDDIFWILSR